MRVTVTAKVWREADTDSEMPEPGTIYDPDSDECNPTEANKAEMREHLAAYERGEWWFEGVVVEINVTNDDDNGAVLASTTASLWGIESNSGEDYFNEVASDLIVEALPALEPMGVPAATILAVFDRDVRLPLGWVAADLRDWTLVTLATYSVSDRPLAPTGLVIVPEAVSA